MPLMSSPSDNMPSPPSDNISFSSADALSSPSDNISSTSDDALSMPDDASQPPPSDKVDSACVHRIFSGNVISLASSSSDKVDSLRTGRVHRVHLVSAFPEGMRHLIRPEQVTKGTNVPGKMLFRRYCKKTFSPENGQENRKENCSYTCSSQKSCKGYCFSMNRGNSSTSTGSQESLKGNSSTSTNSHESFKGNSSTSTNSPESFKGNYSTSSEESCEIVSMSSRQSSHKGNSSSFSSDQESFPSFKMASTLCALGKRSHSLLEEKQTVPFFPPQGPVEKQYQNLSSKARDCLKQDMESEPVPISKKRKKEIGIQKNKIMNYFNAEIASKITMQLGLQTKKSFGTKQSNSLFSKGRISTINTASKSSCDPELTVKQSNCPFFAPPPSVSEVDPESDRFGLFGVTGDYKEEVDGPNLIECLPVELLEQIFCQLPLSDMLNCKLVCQLWNDIIRNGKFIHWKLTYYKLKYGCVETEDTVKALLLSFEGNSVSTCLKGLIRFLLEGFLCKPGNNILYHLKNHQKYISAEKIIEKKLPELTSKNRNPWCILALIILMSKNLFDVEHAFHLLLKSQAVSEALDVMYCIATFLLYCKKKFNINAGFHYRVFCTLHMFENEVPLNPVNSRDTSFVPGQQSIHSYCAPAVQKLSSEQLQIINHRFKQNDVIKVIAFAGSGKTTTLVELARRYPQIQFLNIMFNKSVADYAKKVFPSNVTCRTSHSLAYAALGRLYFHKLVMKVNIDSAAQWMEVKKYPFDPFSFNKFVYHTVQAYVASDDMDLLLKHVPLKKTSDNAVSMVLNEEQREAVLTSAQSFWKNLIDRKNKDCKIWHDVYLKLYQLMKPKLENYHCIMVDEAQDCNPAILSIVLSQNKPVILVGDPNQQIYGFRGSRNALNSISCTHTYNLTQSFRFGPEIAYVASCCLEVLKRNHRNTLVGCRKQSFICGAIHGQYAVIARSNAGLFKEFIRLCCEKNFKNVHEPRTIHGAFAGGIAGYGLDQILDIYYLKMGYTNIESGNLRIPTPKSNLIKSFNSFASLKQFAKKRDDQDLLFKIQLVETYDYKIPGYIETVKKQCNTPMEMANVVFTTAHKAKGLEFDTVCLADDFHVGRLPMEDVKAELDEEYNILYVALTRAKRSLIMSEDLMNVLLKAQEKFEYPLWSSEVLEGSGLTSFTCASCGNCYHPNDEIILARTEIYVSHGETIKGGLLCGHCSQRQHYRQHIVRHPVVMYLDRVKDLAHCSMQFMFNPPTGERSSTDDHLYPRNEVVYYVFNVNL